MLFYSLQETALLLAAAIAIDWLIGDPKWPTHPVILIGRFIKHMERKLHPGTRQLSSGALIRRGAVLAFCTVLLAGTVMYAIVWLGTQLHAWVGFALQAWFISTTIAVKGLKDAAMLVYRPLVAGNLADARRYVGYIVGRDTERLDEREASRAAIETVSENTVDALVSPIVYALLGGAPLAMLYRATNTLDSMVGYRNERYLYFGRVSARLDDVLNYVPARITGWLMIAAACCIRGLSPIRAYRSVRTFAKLHPSPNSGIPESAAAGAIGIELGGVNRYFGAESERARMGWHLKPIEPGHIRLAVKLLYLVSVMLAAGGIAIWAIIYI